MASKISINLDIRKDFNTVIKCKQNDDLPLEVNLFANGEPVDLTNKEIIINGTKDDNTYVKQNTGITKKNNIFNVDYLDRDFTRVPGTTKTEVVLLENGKQDTTFTFYLAIQASVLKGAVQSSNTITILEELDNKTELARQVKEETEQLVTSGGAATKGEVQQINASLDEITNGTEQGESINVEGGIRLGQRKNQPIITFTSDDGNVADFTKLKPIFEAQSIPVTVGIITSKLNTSGYLSTNQLQELSNLGWEISSHTHSHVALAELLTEENIENELLESKNKLKLLGYEVKNIIYPFGSHDERVRRLTRKYYRSGLQVGGGLNDIPLKTYSIRRVALGSYFDTKKAEYPYDTNTLEYYKWQVDKAIANNEWLVFMMHSGYTEHDTVQQQYVTDLLAYIKSLNVITLTVDKALDTLGNLLDVGDIEEKGYTVITPEGSIYSDTIQENTIKVIDSIGINNSTPITSFELGKISVTTLKSSDNAGFPRVAGILETYYIKEKTYAFQLFHAFDQNTTYRRKWDYTNNVWLDWDETVGISKLVIPLIPSSSNLYSANNVITDFPNKKISVFYVNSAGGTGFPNNNAGIVITYRIGGNGYDYQEFHEYNTWNRWKRYVKTNGTWSNWEGASVTLSKSNNAYKSSDLITAYPTGNINYATISNSNTEITSFPEGLSGVLITYSMNDSAYSWQEYHIYNSYKIYKRYWTGSVWSAWTKISVV